VESDDETNGTNGTMAQRFSVEKYVRTILLAPARELTYVQSVRAISIYILHDKWNFNKFPLCRFFIFATSFLLATSLAISTAFLKIWRAVLPLLSRVFANKEFPIRLLADRLAFCHFEYHRPLSYRC
jgi:hypothetical protein